MRALFEASLDSLTASVDALGVAIADPQRHAPRDAFRRARMAYKRVEFLLAYYSPTTVAAVNGSADSDDPDGPPSPLGSRAGFGLLEAAIFGDTSAAVKPQRVVASMLVSLRALRGATTLLTVNDTSALDAMRLELTRVLTTGIEGYDSDESAGAIAESAAALQGIVDGLAQLTTTDHGAERARASALVTRASRALSDAPDFETFDRFGFISTAGIPAARAITVLRLAVDSRPQASRRLWRPSASTPFDSNAFDLSSLAPEYAPSPSPELIATGRRLFFDPRLSGPGTRSCASCHVPTKAFTDGRARAAPLGDTRTPLRNTPTLVNAALQPAMFADERAGFVEDQIRIVLSSPAEMASSPELAAARTGLDERTVRVALAAYIRTLTATEFAVRPGYSRGRGGHHRRRAPRLQPVRRQSAVRDVSLRAAVRRNAAAGVHAIGARDHRRAIIRRDDTSHGRPGLRARARRPLERTSVRVSRAQHPQRRAHRAVHAQRRVRDARAGRRLLRSRRRSGHRRNDIRSNAAVASAPPDVARAVGPRRLHSLGHGFVSFRCQAVTPVWQHAFDN